MNRRVLAWAISGTVILLAVAYGCWLELTRPIGRRP